MKLSKMLFSSNVIAVLAVVGALQACGRSDAPPVNPAGTPAASTQVPTPLPTVVNGCTNGQISIAGGPCMSGTFAQVCYSRGGQLIAGSPEMCRLELRPSNWSMTIQNTTFGEISTDLTLKAGDVLTVEAWGGWNTYGSFLNYSDCDDIGLDGKESGHTVMGANGQPAGLFGYVGNQSYFLGYGGNFNITSDGYLRYRINYPSSSNICNKYGVRAYTIRCVDSAGATHACPY